MGFHRTNSMNPKVLYECPYPIDPIETNLLRQMESIDTFCFQPLMSISALIESLEDNGLKASYAAQCSLQDKRMSK